ncbi:MAG TPA: DUF1634 domain-containing protein [Candidatus Limnocylindrales bacterium]
MNRAPADTGRRDFEVTIGRVVTVGTAIGVTLITVGVALMVVGGVSPLEPSPAFSLRAIGAEVVAGRPRGFLWLGLIAAIATPPARVVGSLIGYLRQGERPMVLVSVAILAVIAGGVALALATGSGVG